MNLGQAAAVCLYELVRTAPGSQEIPTALAATAAEVERVRGLLGTMMEETGYTRRHPANSSEEQIRRLVMRMGLTAADVAVWMGVLRQVLWKVRGAVD